MFGSPDTVSQPEWTSWKSSLKTTVPVAAVSCVFRVTGCAGVGDDALGLAVAPRRDALPWTTRVTTAPTPTTYRTMATPAAAMTTRREFRLVSLGRRRQQLERRLLPGGARLVRSGRLHEWTIFAPVEARRHTGLDRIGAETLHAVHDRLTRSWFPASAGELAFSSHC